MDEKGNLYHDASKRMVYSSSSSESESSYSTVSTKENMKVKNYGIKNQIASLEANLKKRATKLLKAEKKIEIDKQNDNKNWFKKIDAYKNKLRELTKPKDQKISTKLDPVKLSRILEDNNFDEKIIRVKSINEKARVQISETKKKKYFL